MIRTAAIKDHPQLEVSIEKITVTLYRKMREADELTYVMITAGLSILLFDVILTSATVGCLLLGGLGEALLVFSERKGA